jgi:hypothetical protein
MPGTKKTTTKSKAAAPSFTAEERAAMKERSLELKAEAKRGKGDKRAAGEADIMAKLAEMSAEDRAMGERIHALVLDAAPQLMPKTWYGMPAYANEEGKNVCFFQPAGKFKARYATFGFDEAAKLDEGNMWPTSWALTKLTKADEARIVALVKQAIG